MDFLTEYGLFLAKTVTMLVAVLIVIVALFGMGQRQRKAEKGQIEVTHLNQDLEEMTNTLKQIVLEPHALKQELKRKKKDLKREQKEQKERLKRDKSNKEKLGKDKLGKDKLDKDKLDKNPSTDSKVDQPEEADADQAKRRVFVLDFEGDIRASQVASLREEVTAILSLATVSDEVVVRLESPGGMVHSYGLAASQLKRIVDRKIKLIVSVDKVAASGGYMMACIADRIIAAPFALLGSIGVVAQIPNFHKLLKRNDVDVEILTAGEYKRTLTMFGENTEKDREKFQEDIEDVHKLFKDFVTDNRPSVNIEEVATGEAWYGTRALEHKLVDELKTSDELLSEQCQDARVFHIKYTLHKNKMDKIMEKFVRSYVRLFKDRLFGVDNLGVGNLGVENLGVENLAAKNESLNKPYQF